MTPTPNQTAFAEALAREAELIEDLRQLDHTYERYSRLLGDARQQLGDARTAQTEAENVIRSAALTGEPVNPEIRETLTAAQAVIFDAKTRLQALTDELEKIDASKRQLNDEIMVYRRHVARFREAAHREAVQLAIGAFVRGLPDDLPLQAVATTLGCPLSRLLALKG